jgi:DNA-directed RNA polymerase specialized sigma24 family protein
VEVHGGGRSQARLYAHLAAYLGQARGLGARYGATRARTSSLDAPGVVAVADANDVADVLLSEAVERHVDVQREAELLYQQWLEDASERRRRQALTALREFLPDDGSVAAGTVWRRVEGYSPAEIGRQDGVSENAINARLSRWSRQLSPAQREAFAPLRIVTPNPAKARGRRR